MGLLAITLQARIFGTKSRDEKPHSNELTRTTQPTCNQLTRLSAVRWNVQGTTASASKMIVTDTPTLHEYAKLKSLILNTRGRNDTC